MPPTAASTVPSTARKAGWAALRQRAVVTAATAAALAGWFVSAPHVEAAPATARSSEATVRAAHLSPSMPASDIYIASYAGGESLWLDDATYGDVSAYKLLAPGSYTFSLRRHGAAATSAPVRSWALTAQAGDAYTAAIVGSGAKLTGVVLSDNLTPPPAGRANVRLIQASSRAGTAQVVAVAGPVIAQDAAFGTTTGYASINAGTWPITATGGGVTTRTELSLRAGTVTSILLLDAPSGGARLTSVVDAAGSATADAPAHAIDAGGGGTARAFTPAPAGTSAVLSSAASAALGLLIVSLFAAAYRRRVLPGTRRRPGL